MKKMAMVLALGGVLGGMASAATNFVDIGEDVVVSVQNVCTFAGSNDSIDSSFDRNSAFTQPDSINFNYKANQSSNGASQIFNIRCTAQTPVTVTSDGNELSVGDNESPSTLASKKAGATELKVNLNETLAMTTSDGSNTSPDRYRLRLGVQAPAGQYGVVAGDYSRTIVYRFSYEN